MELKEIIKKNRSYRRFDQSHRIDTGILEGLIDLARLSASGANRQPLKYLIYTGEDDCARIFPTLLWAAYLKEWDGPEEGERPSGYIVILGDKSIAEGFGVDHGIAAQSIMLGAAELGLGGCMIASIRKEQLRDELSIPGHYDILLVLAIGKPTENVIIEGVKDGDIKYWRDSNQNHHVPKRDLKDLILKF
jgi:nitroreductase